MANGGMKLDFISPNDVREREDKLRSEQANSEQFSQLKLSIQEYGILQPILVIKDKSKRAKFILNDGLQRLTCARQLNLELIPAIITDIEEDELNWTQIQTNLQGVTTKPLEFGRTIRRLLMNPKYAGMSRAELLTKLGLTKSVSWLNNQLKLNDLLPEAQSLVDSGQIPISNAYELAKLPVDEQIHYLEQAQTETTDKFILLVTNKLQELKASRQGKAEESLDPLRMAKFISKTQAKTIFVDLEKMLAKNPEDKYVQGQYDMARKFMSIDDQTLKAKEMEKNKKKQERDEIIRRRKELMEQRRKEIDAEIKNQLQAEGLLTN